MSFKDFILKVFTSNTGVSSRRVLAFLFSVNMIVMIYFEIDVEYIKILAWLIAGINGLTTASPYFNNKDNGKKI